MKFQSGHQTRTARGSKDIKPTVRKLPEDRLVILDLRFRKGILRLRRRDERDGGGSDLV